MFEPFIAEEADRILLALSSLPSGKLPRVQIPSLGPDADQIVTTLEAEKLVEWTDHDGSASSDGDFFIGIIEATAIQITPLGRIYVRSLLRSQKQQQDYQRQQEKLEQEHQAQRKKDKRVAFVRECLIAALSVALSELAKLLVQ